MNLLFKCTILLFSGPGSFENTDITDVKLWLVIRFGADSPLETIFPSPLAISRHCVCKCLLSPVFYITQMPLHALSGGYACRLYINVRKRTVHVDVSLSKMALYNKSTDCFLIWGVICLQFFVRRQQQSCIIGRGCTDYQTKTSPSPSETLNVNRMQNELYTCAGRDCTKKTKERKPDRTSTSMATLISE